MAVARRRRRQLEPAGERDFAEALSFVSRVPLRGDLRARWCAHMSAGGSLADKRLTARPARG